MILFNLKNSHQIYRIGMHQERLVKELPETYILDCFSSFTLVSEESMGSIPSLFRDDIIANK